MNIYIIEIIKIFINWYIIIINLQIMRNWEFYAAVFWIIKNKKWEILFQRRKNTWFSDWLLQLPSWHIEWEEFFKEALIREMKEEININISENDIDVQHISHRIRKNERTYFDVYLIIKNYSGEIFNNEPEKCSELKFIDLSDYNKDEMVGFDINILKMIQKWETFSEFIF